jgi:hypothetical protein
MGNWRLARLDLIPQLNPGSIRLREVWRGSLGTHYASGFLRLGQLSCRKMFSEGQELVSYLKLSTAV